MDEDTVRVVLVKPAAGVRSASSTMAMTYDWRVGTSIWERDWRQRSRATAVTGVGAKATAMRKTLDGTWLKTMVRRRPIRRAIRSASRNEAAVTSWVRKKMVPRAARSRPNR